MGKLFRYHEKLQQVSPWMYYKVSVEDTAFQNDTFKKVIGYTAVDTFVMGGLKEDTLAKKVYGFFSNDTSFSLMYDWNLKKGDTVHYAKASYIVKDSVGISINGKPSFKYVFEDFYGKMDFSLSFIQYINALSTHEHSWIPEIGSSIGLLNPCVQLRSAYELKEFLERYWIISIKSVVKSSDTLFKSEVCGHFLLYNSGEQLTDNGYCKVSVIPGEKLINVASAKPVKKLIIYNVLGLKGQSHQDFSDKYNVRVPYPCAPGLSIIKILFEDDTELTTKVIIN